ncbi:MAG TPA: right-handed parallel beta-helix repeat-containing protein [Terriglobales bacterium]|nr:right-handed parallel beta-helix repeat-containing protein [Terriglobales bacterium]
MAIGSAGAQLATDCTLYASPAGGGNGSTPSSPTTFQSAASATVAGSVVCLEGGTYSLSSTFNPPHSGTSSAWIVYKAYGDGPPVINWTGCSGAGCRMFAMSGTFPNGPHYIEFNGLNLDGKNLATNGFSCNGSHHLRFLNNNIKNTGGAGIAAIECDYLTSDHNVISHNGYAPCCGWTSAISYNSDQFFDNNAGLHNIISNNILTGEFDSSSNHTDGNGIILDLSCRSGCGTLATANTPPVLIMNNVVYQNGGRCISANAVSDFYVINNTCYKNGEDLTMNNPPGSFVTHESTTGYFVNNISYDWHNTTSAWGGASVRSFQQEGSNSAISYYKDMWFIGGLNFTPSDPSQFFNQDPLFVSALSVNPNLGDQEATALNPSLLGNDLTLQATSPAVSKGIDPSTISGLPSAIVTDLRKYIYTDINGTSRSAGTWDLGAYQAGLSSSTPPPSAPSGLTAVVH